MKYIQEIRPPQERPQEPSAQTPEILPVRRAFKDGLYVTLGKAVSFLASFAVITVLARNVPRETAGAYSYIMATLAIASIATLPGMNKALVSAIARGHKGSLGAMMHKRIRWGFLGSLIALGIGAFYLIKGNQTLGFSFLLASPFIPLTDTFSNFAVSFWQGKKRFGKSAFVGALYYVGIALLGIPFILISDNVLVIVLGMLAAQALAGWVVYRPVKKIAVGTEDQGAARLGMHLTVMQGIKILDTHIDRVIVWHLLGPAMVAIYTFAATPMQKAIQMIPIGIVALPHLSESIWSKQLKKTILRKTLLLFGVSVPATVLAILLAPFVYKILFPLYPESVKYFQILALSLMFSPALLLKSAFIAFSKTKTLYASEIIAPIFKILLMATLAYFYGIMGLAVAVVIGSVLVFIVTLILFCRLSAPPSRS